ncbi:MAG: FtsX-like permease family protein, partial [Candidatus Omnitrophota bacterium]
GDSKQVIKKRFLLFFKKNKEIDRGSILIGENLAARLQVGVGDVITLISPFRSQAVTKSIMPTQAEAQPFVVRGVFRLGMSDFDSALAVISLPRAQKIYHLGNKVTGLSVRFMNVDEAQKWKNLIGGLFGHDYIVRSWYDMNENFFQALKVEKSVMTILLALIILVAAFNIISTLIMVVMEKTKDIGILRALGATKSSIRRIFLLEGLSIGSLGVIVGTTLGLVVAFNLNPISDFIKMTTGFEVFPSDIYYFDKIPVIVYPPDVVLVVSFALIAAVMAGVFPANRASKLQLVDALRYE